MKYSRNVDNIGTPEDIFLSGSTQGAFKNAGCTQQGNPNINRGLFNRGLTGGQRVVSTFDSNIPMGPKGGLVGHTSQSNCGITNPLNLNASSQIGGNYGTLEEGTAMYGFDSVKGTLGVPPGAFSYPPISNTPRMGCNMNGGTGGEVCRDVNQVKSYNQVQHFWSQICPGAVMIYKKYAKKNSKYLLPFIKDYTRAFCEEVQALNAKTNAKRKKHLVRYKHFMKRAEQSLHKMNKNAHDYHNMVYDRHFQRIKTTITSGNTKRSNTKRSNTKKNKLSTRKRNTRSNKKRKMTRKMKGGEGYHQFNSNVPNTNSYGLNEGTLLPSGTLANPMPYQIQNNCNDVYNHYTGINSEAPMRQ